MKRQAPRAGPAKTIGKGPALLAARPRVGPRFKKRLILRDSSAAGRLRPSCRIGERLAVDRLLGFPSWRIAGSVLGRCCLLTLLDRLACTVVPINCSLSRLQCGLGYHTSSFSVLLLCCARGVRLRVEPQRCPRWCTGCSSKNGLGMFLLSPRKVPETTKKNGTYYDIDTCLGKKSRVLALPLYRPY